jgi:linoleoyl-CoA desaturase
VSGTLGSSPAAERIRFRGTGEFSRLLNERAQAVISDPRMMRRAYRVVWAKSALVLVWTLASYLFLLLAAGSPAAAIPGAVSLGLTAAAIGFCIMHDANHGGYSTNRVVNRLASHSLDLIGGSSYVWSAKHLAHHTYTNVAEHDPDVDALPFARFEPSQRRRRWHRYQHVYMWLLYAFVTVRWQAVTDFTFLARGSVGRSRFRRPRGWNLAGLVTGKLFFVVWAVAIPLALHSALHVAEVFLLASAVASLSLTVTFQLSHCLEEAITLDPEDATAGVEWHIHQVEATADFAQRNTVIRWYVGGLNHQIEHHLFPRVPHTLHPQLAGIVRATALECGVTYNAHPTMRAALASHVRWLKRMGAAVPEPAG